jgi:hypothetical protein
MIHQTGCQEIDEQEKINHKQERKPLGTCKQQKAQTKVRDPNLDSETTTSEEARNWSEVVDISTRLSDTYRVEKINW